MIVDDAGEQPAPAGIAWPLAWDELLRTARHELRTPINHIVGYSELLLDVAAELGQAAILADLGRIRAAGAELCTLVNDSLDAARVQHGLPDTVALNRALRTPLHTIIGYSELLEDEAEAGGYDDLRSDLQRIRNAGQLLLVQVHVLLELAADAGPAPRGLSGPMSTATSASRPAAETAALLVVDDDEANRDMVSRRLERLGHAVAVAEDGRAALAIVAERPFYFILLDIVMPAMDGYEVLQHLKASEALRHIPVVVFSASDVLDAAVRCIGLGAEDYLGKPIDAVLRASVGACLEKKRLHDRGERHLATIERMAADLAEWDRTLEGRVARQVGELERAGSLQRFLPPQLVAAIMEAGDESLLESHRRQVAVVFCDLRGFTAFSELAEAEEVMEVLAQYHAAMGELISRYEGTVEHFAGDGPMVVFNDPFPCPNPEGRAVQMREQMAVEDLAVLESVGDLALKGIRDPVPAYEVLGFQDAASDGRRQPQEER